MSVVRKERARQWDIVWLLLIICVGFLLRWDFLTASDFRVDADEAIVGLMAQDISREEPIPVFYYGQHYMGSFESILLSGLYSLFGFHLAFIKLVPLFFSLLFIGVVFLLGRELAGRSAGFIAAILCAVSPGTLLVWSGKARGGFIEIVFFAAVAVLLTMYWFRRERVDWIRLGIIAFILGFGWWLNNQIVYVYVPIAFGIFVKLWGQGKNYRERMMTLIVSFIACSLLAILGGLPFWIYNLELGFPSIDYLFRGGEVDTIAHARGFFVNALPILFGAKRYWQTQEVFSGSLLLLVANLLVSVTLLVIGVRARRVASHAFWLLTGVLLATGFIFITSPYGHLSQAPRYLLPLYLVFFPMMGSAITEGFRLSRPLGIALLASVIGLHISSAYLHGRAIPGEPFVFQNERVAKDHAPVITRLNELGIEHVRTNYWIGYRLAYETEQAITFTLFREPHQVRIESFEERERSKKEVLPYLLVPAQARRVEQALTTFRYSYERENLGAYMLLYEISPQKEPRLTKIPSSAILSISANTGVEDMQPQNAFDGVLETRWGSGEPQHPHMEFTVEFYKPQRVRAFRYFLSHWQHDYPRELALIGETEKGEKVSLLSADEFHSACYFFEYPSESFEDSYWPFDKDTKLASVADNTPPIKRLTVKQSGTHPVLDWSIAELEFYTD